VFDNYLGYSICVNDTKMELFVGIGVWSFSVSIPFFYIKKDAMETGTVNLLPPTFH
jgi:hypothetical protein